MLNDMVTVRLELEQEEVETEQGALAAIDGTEIGPVEEVPPANPLKPRFAETCALVVTVSVMGLAGQLIRWRIRRRERKEECGTLIDLRTQPPTITIVPNVPAGYVAVIDKEGKLTSSVEQYDTSESLAGLLRKLTSQAGAKK